MWLKKSRSGKWVPELGVADTAHSSYPLDLEEDAWRANFLMPTHLALRILVLEAPLLR
jgi:hypothetical protein